MFCDQCGAQLDVGARFCNRCGKEIKGSIDFTAPRPSRVQAHVRLLGILWLALSAFEAVTGVAALVLADSIFSHQFGIHGLPMFLEPLMRGIAIFSLVKSCAGFAAGWGLLNRQPWARAIAIAVGIVSLFFHFPFGTALGIYTLWVLLPAHSEVEYEKYHSTAA